MLLVFQIFFPTPIISRIESIGGGQAGGGWGEAGAVGKPKATIQTQRAVLCLQCVTQTDTIHKGGQDWCEEQPSTPCSPINTPQDHEMYPRGFTALINSRLRKHTWSSMVKYILGVLE